MDVSTRNRNQLNETPTRSSEESRLGPRTPRGDEDDGRGPDRPRLFTLATNEGAEAALHAAFDTLKGLNHTVSTAARTNAPTMRS